MKEHYTQFYLSLPSIPAIDVISYCMIIQVSNYQIIDYRAASQNLVMSGINTSFKNSSLLLRDESEAHGSNRACRSIFTQHSTLCDSYSLILRFECLNLL